MTSCVKEHISVISCPSYTHYTQSQFEEIKIELDIIRDAVGNSMIEVFLIDFANTRKEILECIK